MIPKNSTFVIAEAGINHNGDLELAKNLVREAASVGADAIKFQIWEASEFHSTPDEYERLEALQFDASGWGEIKDTADTENIIFFASTFSKASVDFLLDDLNAPLVKVASGDITHIPLLEHIANKNRPVILSTGMSSLGEIERAVNVVQPPDAQVYILECLSAYPADLSDYNLDAIRTLERAFGRRIGFSDHTMGTIAPSVAVAKGATIIEKHFTLDKNDHGADHKLSLEPAEFAIMVDQIREIEKGIGDGVKRPMPAESEFIHKMRRGLKARVDIDAGESFTEDNVKVARPRSGIEPASYELIIQRKADTPIQQDEPIIWENVI